MKRTGRSDPGVGVSATRARPRAVRARRASRGFTLIELLVAITILAVVAVLSWRGLDQIIRGRNIIEQQMGDERVIAQLFAQLAIDARQATTDDIAGAPALSISPGMLQIVRTLRVEGQPPRLQVVRYRLLDNRIVRQASPGLSTQGQLNDAMHGGADGWSSLALMYGARSFSAQLFVPDTGFTTNMKDVVQAIARANAAMNNPLGGAAPPARSVLGVEVDVGAAGQQHPLTRVLLVGQ
jgi:general secretion pathway protein J